jgi:cysteine-rich repeat protein
MTIPKRFTFALVFIGLCFWATPRFARAAGYCGDGILQPDLGEECDDGNFVDRDGCSARCKIEDMTPPTIASVSIPDGTQNVPTTTNTISVVFSEPVDSSSIDYPGNIRLEHDAAPMDISWVLGSDQKTLTISIKEDLFGDSKHALRIKNIKDLPGNVMKDESITVFETGTYIDHTPPNVVIDPPGGSYNFPQQVTLTPYLGAFTGNPDYLDKTAKTYFTLDGSDPTDKSTLYTQAISVTTDKTLKYFSVDSVGNRTPILTESYKFGCPDLPHAKKFTPYPRCKILDCERGTVLRGNACVVSLEDVSADDYKTNAVTAPLFPSTSPMTITSKPSLYITPQHQGLLPRPIIFKDLKRNITLQFDQNTKIRTADGLAFSGYLKPPANLYMKDFPINFGYSFRSIFQFKAADGRDLTFSPPFHITAPYTDAFNPDEGVTLFTYDPKTETYTPYDPKLYSFDLTNKQVTFTSGTSGIFFIAQSGENFNRSVFTDIQNHWAKNYIEALYRKGIVKGKDNGIFAPDDLVTRADFITIALKAAGIDIPSVDSIESAPFKDSPLDAWFTPYMAKAKELGLIKGFADRSIRPGKLVSRAEAIKILLSAFQFDLTPTAKAKTPFSEKTTQSPATTFKDFPDVPDGQWFTPYIDFALRNGLVNGLNSIDGTPLNLFGPEKPMTRGEMAKLTIKTLDLKEKLASAH